ncbi:MAG: hypothetical protein OXH09_17080 [Gammaproteobacteria bacterium]|nr:hypothetical protein [Gammaproteobacteria bacterium]
MMKHGDLIRFEPVDPVVQPRNADEAAAEIERFLQEASAVRFDGQAPVGLDAEEGFDPDSVRWYRRVFDERTAGRHSTLSDVEFLPEWGFVVEQENRLAPTRATLLVFGKPRHLRQMLPRPVVDCQFIDSAFDSWSPEDRWSDRIEVENNLIQAWLMLSERYIKHAKHPFSVDATTAPRDDDPPDYISFREAAINLLIHQDYGDHDRTALIRFFRDRTVFWNPGDASAMTEELLDPAEKEVRNPAIVAAFRRIGLSEQAGTGLPAAFHHWQRLGHVPPIIDNDRARRTFELRLLREELPSEAQRRLHAQRCSSGRCLGATLRVRLSARLSVPSRCQGRRRYMVSPRVTKPTTGWSLVTDQPRDQAGDLVTPSLTNLGLVAAVCCRCCHQNCTDVQYDAIVMEVLD